MAKIASLLIAPPEERRTQALLTFVGRVAKSNDPLVQEALRRLRTELGGFATPPRTE